MNVSETQITVTAVSFRGIKNLKYSCSLNFYVIDVIATVLMPEMKFISIGNTYY